MPGHRSSSSKPIALPVSGETSTSQNYEVRTRSHHSPPAQNCLETFKEYSRSVLKPLHYDSPVTPTSQKDVGDRGVGHSVSVLPRETAERVDGARAAPGGGKRWRHRTRPPQPRTRPAEGNACRPSPDTPAFGHNLFLPHRWPAGFYRDPEKFGRLGKHGAHLPQSRERRRSPGRPGKKRNAGNTLPRIPPPRRRPGGSVRDSAGPVHYTSQKARGLGPQSHPPQAEVLSPLRTGTTRTTAVTWVTTPRASVSLS